MNQDIAISVANVSKSFKLPHEKHSGLKQAILSFKGGMTYETQHALADISFEIKRGEFFGIVGRNGSGKSTMLKILAGIYQPTQGTATVHGQLVPFIELGVGFNPELTGRENVYLNGALLGFSRKQTEVIYQDIVDFAELPEFMDQKLKNYSSGMQVRLAFSIAIQAKADILLIDEVLAVGDENFQKKCIGVFEQLKREGRTIIFVSHSMAYVREFCDRVAVIDRSKLLYVGDTEKAIDIYNKLNADRESEQITIENEKSLTNTERLGNGDAEITAFKVINSQARETINLVAGERFSISVDVLANKNIEKYAVGVMFRKSPQENLYGLNSYYQKTKMKSVKNRESVRVIFTDNMPLNPGSYFLSIAVAGMNVSGHEDYDNLNNVAKVNVIGSSEYWGMIYSQPKITTGEISD